jgi:hypothetical protein
MVIEMEEPTKHCLLEPPPHLITGSPLIGTPTLGRVCHFEAVGISVGEAKKRPRPTNPLGPKMTPLDKLMPKLRDDGSVKVDMSIADIHRVVVEHWPKGKNQAPGRDLVARYLKLFPDFFK